MLHQETSAAYEVPKRTKKILVVGDWVVDDHWVTGIHRSPTSSRTGRAHYRALHPLCSPVQCFCAAGRVAWVLHRVRSFHGQYCNVFGLGLWHPDDTNILTAMLDSGFITKLTPYKIMCPKPEPVDGLKLVNLNQAVADENSSGDPHGPFGTTRVIRIYQHTGSSIDQIERIDWELPDTSGHDAWITKKDSLANSRLDNDLESEKDSIDAVVVKDICKGVVSEAVISWLADKFKNVPWFVSTKAWHPEWLKRLEGVDLRLLLVPQVAAQTAVRKASADFSCWLTRTGEPSGAALAEMDKLAEYGKKKDPMVVVLPEGFTVLARDYRERKLEAVTQIEPRPDSVSMDLYMASVFFPALVVHLMHAEGKKVQVNLKKSLQKALDFTRNWTKFEVRRIEEPDRWPPKDEKEPWVELDDPDPKTVLGNWKDFSWDETKGRWDKALSDQGVIREGGSNYLELWRAMTEIDGYVCCTKTKRNTLRRLVQGITYFKDKGRNRHTSYMLIAPTGSGKTYLARCLAKCLGLRYLPFNVTQMLSKGDILDCFDTIVTTQAQNRQEPVLVFVDEINAKLAGQQVYDAFLAPIAEGAYVRGGKVFHIDPCVWIFAGTQPLPKKERARQDKSNKISDFISRLTESPHKLEVKPEEKRHKNTENVYIGVSLLRSIFPDVREVSTKVLKAFHWINPDLRVRQIERFVKSFVDIQYGRVMAKNAPSRWFRQLGIPKDDWNKLGEGDMVEIRS